MWKMTKERRVRKGSGRGSRRRPENGCLPWEMTANANRARTTRQPVVTVRRENDTIHTILAVGCVRGGYLRILTIASNLDRTDE